MITVGSRLDHLLASRFLPEHWTDRLWSSGQLPDCLRWCVNRLATDADWRAYHWGGSILFAVARSHPQAAAAADSASLDVAILDGNGALRSTAVWNYDRHSGWLPAAMHA